MPTMDSLNAHPELAALRADWATMLAHQLPALPPFDEFWDELPQVFAWLYSGARRATASVIPSMASRGETVDESWHAPAMATSWRREGVTAPLELIRFAAANHLCVDLRYRDEQGKVGWRLIEPYALRRTNNGALLLHAVRHHDERSRTYRVDRILGAKVTPTRFVPRYAVELSASDPIHQPLPPRARTAPRTMSALPARRLLTPSQPSSLGLTYVYECAYCRKRFQRKAADSRLKPHKSKDGWPCPGRTGLLVDTRH